MLYCLFVFRHRQTLAHRVQYIQDMKNANTICLCDGTFTCSVCQDRAIIKTVYVTEYTYLYPNGGIQKIEQKYSSCEGPIEDYIGYGDTITGNMKAQYNLNVIVNHKVTVPSYVAEVRWFDNTSGKGMLRLENGESVWMHCSSIDPKAFYYPIASTPKLEAGDKLIVTLYDNDCAVGSARFRETAGDLLD